MDVANAWPVIRWNRTLAFRNKNGSTAIKFAELKK